MQLLILSGLCPGPLFQGLERADLLALLTIVIALSAYLATIRLYLFGLRHDNKKTTERFRIITNNLRFLSLADGPMTLSAIFLGLYLLVTWNFRWMLWTGEGLFVFAGLVMLAFHVYGWYKTWRG